MLTKALIYFKFSNYTVLSTFERMQIISLRPVVFIETIWKQPFEIQVQYQMNLSWVNTCEFVLKHPLSKKFQQFKTG